VRYMFLMNPDEQRQLLAAGPATTALPTPSTTQHHARANKKRPRLNHARRRSRAAWGAFAARMRSQFWARLQDSTGFTCESWNL